VTHNHSANIREQEHIYRTLTSRHGSQHELHKLLVVSDIAVQEMKEVSQFTRSND